jgi:hypothetical protein
MYATEHRFMTTNGVCFEDKPGTVALSFRLLFLAGLTALFLSPTVKTGYVADGITNSLTPGMLKLSGSSLIGAVWSVNRDLTPSAEMENTGEQKP